MKLSSVVLLVTLVLLLFAMFATNIALKKEYDKIDKSDLYWTYGTILEQPFKHLRIEGGNITHIVFEQSKKSSVRVFKNWQGYENKMVQAFVKNDTLFVKFPEISDPGEKRYMGFITPVRIFSPELLSVNAYNTSFRLSKLKQKSISITASGRSKVVVESFLHDFDSIHVSQTDSTNVGFAMSPELIGTDAGITMSEDGISSVASSGGPRIITPSSIFAAEKISSRETLTVKTLEASVQGVSLLDVGHFQINSLKLNIADTSGIILSGGTLRNFKR
ncbi:MAG TPA: hypothetical protein VF540_12575 [Segetibacter sp.]